MAATAAIQPARSRGVREPKQSLPSGGWSPAKRSSGSCYMGMRSASSGFESKIPPSPTLPPLVARGERENTETRPGSADRIEVVSTAAGYDRWAEIYDGEDNPLIWLEEKHIRPLLGDVHGLNVADIGCGTGRHALRLAAAG